MVQIPAGALPTDSVSRRLLRFAQQTPFVRAPTGLPLAVRGFAAHDRFDRDDGFDTTVDWTLPGGETVPRYYHIYSPAEFEADLAASDLVPIDVRVSSGNCYAVVGSRDS